MILACEVWFGGMRGEIRGEHGHVRFVSPQLGMEEPLGTVKADLYLYPADGSIPSQTFGLLFRLGLVEYRIGDRAGGLAPRWRWKGEKPLTVRGEV